MKFESRLIPSLQMRGFSEEQEDPSDPISAQNS